MEHFFICPYCNAHISMVLDLTEISATFIEDCQTCCRPIQITFKSEDEALTEFEARSLND